jgi:hypothetical protein
MQGLPYSAPPTSQSPRTVQGVGVAGLGLGETKRLHLVAVPLALPHSRPGLLPRL